MTNDRYIRWKNNLDLRYGPASARMEGRVGPSLTKQIDSIGLLISTTLILGAFAAMSSLASVMAIIIALTRK